MQATVLGASGQIGQEIVARAAEQGFDVRAVWRRAPESVPSGVELAVEPELLDVGALRRCCHDADIIFVSVGHRRASPRNPWSKVLSPADLCQQLAALLLEALGDRSVPMYFVSAAGVGESRERMSAPLRVLIDHSKIGLSYADLAAMEARLRDSGRDCLVVQPTTLTNRGSTESRVVDAYGLLSNISRHAVARYLVDRAVAGDVRGYAVEMLSGA